MTCRPNRDWVHEYVMLMDTYSRQKRSRACRSALETREPKIRRQRLPAKRIAAHVRRYIGDFGGISVHEDDSSIKIMEHCSHA